VAQGAVHTIVAQQRLSMMLGSIRKGELEKREALLSDGGENLKCVWVLMVTYGLTDRPTDRQMYI
jgi:hypothetical protein